MADPRTPGPRRKLRAGIAVAAIIALLVVFIFLARNIQHGTQIEEEGVRVESPG
jgi:hypothetical protein